MRMRECLLLQIHVGVDVDLRGFYRLVAQPKRDDSDVHSPTEKVHGSRVSERMGGDLFPCERGTAQPGCGGVLGYKALQRISAEGTSARAGEYGIASVPALLLDPLLEDRSNILA